MTKFIEAVVFDRTRQSIIGYVGSRPELFAKQLADEHDQNKMSESNRCRLFKINYIEASSLTDPGVSFFEKDLISIGGWNKWSERVKQTLSIFNPSWKTLFVTPNLLMMLFLVPLVLAITNWDDFPSMSLLQQGQLEWSTWLKQLAKNVFDPVDAQNTVIYFLGFFFFYSSQQTEALKDRFSKYLDPEYHDIGTAKKDKLGSIFLDAWTAIYSLVPGRGLTHWIRRRFTGGMMADFRSIILVEQVDCWRETDLKAMRLMLRTLRNTNCIIIIHMPGLSMLTSGFLDLLYGEKDRKKGFLSRQIDFMQELNDLPAAYPADILLDEDYLRISQIDNRNTIVPSPDDFIRFFSDDEDTRDSIYNAVIDGRYTVFDILPVLVIGSSHLSPFVFRIMLGDGHMKKDYFKEQINLYLGIAEESGIEISDYDIKQLLSMDSKLIYSEREGGAAGQPVYRKLIGRDGYRYGFAKFILQTQNKDRHFDYLIRALMSGQLYNLNRAIDTIESLKELEAFPDERDIIRIAFQIESVFWLYREQKEIESLANDQQAQNKGSETSLSINLEGNSNMNVNFNKSIDADNGSGGSIHEAGHQSVRQAEPQTGEMERITLAWNDLYRAFTQITISTGRLFALSGKTRAYLEKAYCLLMKAADQELLKDSDGEPITLHDDNTLRDKLSFYKAANQSNSWTIEGLFYHSLDDLISKVGQLPDYKGTDRKNLINFKSRFDWCDAPGELAANLDTLCKRLLEKDIDQSMNAAENVKDVLDLFRSFKLLPTTLFARMVSCVGQTCAMGNETFINIAKLGELIRNAYRLHEGDPPDLPSLDWDSKPEPLTETALQALLEFLGRAGNGDLSGELEEILMEGRRIYETLLEALEDEPARHCDIEGIILGDQKSPLKELELKASVELCSEINV